MNSLFRVALLGSCWMVALVQAEEKLPQALSTLIRETTPFSARSADRQHDVSDMAAWMLEASMIAKDYVDGLDRGHYAQSWVNGDSLFQKTINQQQWTEALEQKRKPLGRVRSRTLRDQRSTWDPPGLPTGPYMVVELDTEFERRIASLELLTLRRDDGKWRVLTYQIY